MAIIGVALAAAVLTGVVVALVLSRRQTDVQRTVAAELAVQLQRDAEAGRQAGVDAAIERVVELAGERLAAQATRGAAELESNKSLIDQQLAAMRTELERVTGLVTQVERDRAEQYGQLAQQITAAGTQTAQLAETTRQLREALSSTKARGQWGERMAEDVLRLAGFIEGVQYRKQKAVAGGGIPDFTFLLPEDREVRMDVKFPLDNYLRYLEADSDTAREASKKAFLRDVRARVRELAGRDYIDPDTTVDCVLLFIPNEQLYAFVQEQDAPLLDEALRRKVVLCSPMTLFAVLAVIRQAMESFQLARTSDEILTLLGGFRQQWTKYTEHVDKLGTQLDRVHKTYDELVGPRRRMLERPLEKLDDLRLERGLDTGGDHGDDQGRLALAEGAA